MKHSDIFKKALAALLGGFFITIGVLKILVAGGLAEAISTITLLSSNSAHIVAIGTIALEIVCGTFLILRYRIVVASIALCFLLAIFIWVLLTAVLRDREIACHCFGMLDINLPNRVELTIDVILFDCLALLGFLHAGKPRHIPDASSKKKLSAIMTLVVLLYLEFAMVYPAYHREVGGIPVNLQPVYSFIAKENQTFIQNADEGNRLILAMRFSDFNCSLCFDDFISLSDSIDLRLSAKERQRVVAVFCQDDIADPKRPERLREWASRNGIAYTIVIAPDTLFSQIGINKSTVIVLNERGESMFSREIPIGVDQQKKVLQYLRRTRG